jgi:HAD superfamily hydrolase (TIGR01450 family)
MLRAECHNRQTVSGLLNDVRGFILDVDGTLVLAADPNVGGGIAPLPGAAETLARIGATGRRFVCFTNGSGQVPSAQAARLRAVGLPIEDTQLLTPAVVAAAYVQRHHAGQSVLAFGNEGLLQPLRSAGVDVTSETRSAGVVLIGADPDFTYDKLVKACRAVWAGAPLLVTSMAPYFAARDGRMPSTSGAIAAGIVHATGAEPIVVGKPSAVAMQVLCDLLGEPAERIAVVGDDLDLEIRMGQAAGARTVLVLSGTTSEDHIAPPPPDLVLPSIAELCARLEA